MLFMRMREMFCTLAIRLRYLLGAVSVYSTFLGLIIDPCEKRVDEFSSALQCSNIGMNQSIKQNTANSHDYQPKFENRPVDFAFISWD